MNNPENYGRSVEARRPPGYWKAVLRGTKEQLGKDNLSLVAAGVSFYLLLALFPGIAAAISLYGLVSDPAQIQEQFAALQSVLPPAVHEAVTGEMTRVATGRTVASFGAIGGILFALWSGSKGMSALIQAMNIIYDQEEKRGFIKLTFISIVFTLGAILMLAIAVALIAIVPTILGFVGLGVVAEKAVVWGRWVLLFLMAIAALSLLYRFGPCSRCGRGKPWFSWGAVIATVLLLIVSIGFSVYVSNFANYNKTYGSLGAVVVLLMWLYLSSYVILLGGELNSEMERATARAQGADVPPKGQHRETRREPESPVRLKPA